jgi:hypothetical protein
MGRGMPGSAEFDTAPFSLSRDHLPRMYLGHNIRTVSRLLHDKKSGPFSPNSLYAFLVPYVDNAYDSREESLQSYFEVAFVLSNGVRDKTRKGFRIVYEPQMDNHFTIKGADGREIEIEEVKFRDFIIAFKNLGRFPVELGEPPAGKMTISQPAGKSRFTVLSDSDEAHETIVGRFSMTPKEADHIREGVNLLAICTLVDPYVTSETVHRMGTAEQPGEYLAQHEYVHVRLVELWFYDFSTGKVLMKLKPSGGAG